MQFLLLQNCSYQGLKLMQLLMLMLLALIAGREGGVANSADTDSDATRAKEVN